MIYNIRYTATININPYHQDRYEFGVGNGPTSMQCAHFVSVCGCVYLCSLSLSISVYRCHQKPKTRINTCPCRLGDDYAHTHTHNFTVSLVLCVALLCVCTMYVYQRRQCDYAATPSFLPVFVFPPTRVFRDRTSYRTHYSTLAQCAHERHN